MYRLCTLSILLTFGCGGTQKKTEVEKPKTTADVESWDRNNDGKPDSWKYFVKSDGKLVLDRKEFDLNFDTKVDVKRHYNQAGDLIKDEVDMDFDENIDVTTYYENNQPTKRVTDLQFDNKPDVTRYYSKGVLVRTESDTDNDGEVDYWEHHKDGRLVRIGTDEDGDGQPDPDKWQDK